MYSCNFAAMNEVLNKKMKKLDMEYGSFIYTIITYLMLWLRFKKELVMLCYVKNFIRLLETYIVIAVCRYNLI